MCKLCADKWHQVTHANYSFFPEGMVHPDRIMECHDLIYMLDGEWEIYQDGQPYLLTKNQVLLLTAGKHHYGYQKCSKNTHTMYLHFSSFSEEMDKTDNCTEAVYLQLGTLVHCDAPLVIKSLFEEIIHLNWSTDEFKDTLMSAKLKILLWQLSKLKDLQKSKDDSISIVVDLLTRDHGKFYTIEELAAHINMSPRVLTRKFKLATSTTIHQYQLNLKLDMAAAEIKSYPDVTFREIASNYGFYDEFHFSRCFKNKFGFSPKALKQ